MSKKNWIFIKRGLSEDPKHRQAMGDAIWLYMHICDAADWEKGIVYDWRDKDIGIDMSLSTATVRTWRDRLSKCGYITCNQKQHCLEVVIHNWTNPRDYSGKKMNAIQGDVAKSPSKQEKVEGIPQGVPQDDMQGLDDSTVADASFIESSSSSSSLSIEERTEKQKLYKDLESASFQVFGNDVTAWRKLAHELEKDTVTLFREDGRFVIGGVGLKSAMFQDRYARTFSRVLSGVYDHPTEVIFTD